MADTVRITYGGAQLVANLVAIPGLPASTGPQTGANSTSITPASDASFSTIPYGSGVPWKYNTATGGITDTANVTLALAPGAGKRNYITGLQYCNTSAVASEITVLDGAATVIWRGVAPASMTQTTVVEITPPIFSAVNGTMQLKMVTTGTATVVAAQGYSL